MKAGKRHIRDGAKYDRYFPSGLGTYTVIMEEDSDTDDAVKLMKKVISETKADTVQIAKVLYTGDLRSTCRNIWDFCYNYIQYKEDAPGKEQIRRPSRVWMDRESGVDCDCYSVFISSILSNLGIVHKLRKTKYGGDWQHIYVVVPTQNNNYITIDPVTDQFDYEVRYTDKKDYPMQNREQIGLGTPIDVNAVLNTGLQTAGAITNSLIQKSANAEQAQAQYLQQQTALQQQKLQNDALQTQLQAQALANKTTQPDSSLPSWAVPAMIAGCVVVLGVIVLVATKSNSGNRNRRR